MQGSLFYESLEEAEKRCNEREVSLAGLYQVQENVLHGASGGRLLEACKSKREGRQPYYLRDAETRQFVSSIFTDNGYREIEAAGKRYRLVSRDSQTVEIVYLRDVKKRGFS